MEPVPADPATAKVYLDHARDFLADASNASTKPASRQVLAWQACTSTMEAVLLACGRRVTTGDAAHVVRMEEAQRLLDEELFNLFERLDGHRELRHEVSYHAGVISQQEAAVTLEDARELLEAAERFIG